MCTPVPMDDLQPRQRGGYTPFVDAGSLPGVSLRTSATSVSIGVPVGNTAATPRSSSACTSACGTVPPTTTLMSPTPDVAQRLDRLAGEARCARPRGSRGRRGRRPPAARSRRSPRLLADAGVDDLEAGVAQRPGHELGARGRGRRARASPRAPVTGTQKTAGCWYSPHTSLSSLVISPTVQYSSTHSTRWGMRFASPARPRAAPPAPRARPGVAGAAHLGQAVELHLARRRRPSPVAPASGAGWSLSYRFDADDHALTGVDLALHRGRLVGDEALHVAVLDALDHAAVPFEVGHDLDDLLLHRVGQRLDEVRPAQRVDGAGHAGLVGEDLLRAERERGALLGGERERLVPRGGEHRLHAAEHRRHRLVGDAHDVVVRLLRLERPAAAHHAGAEHRTSSPSARRSAPARCAPSAAVRRGTWRSPRRSRCACRRRTTPAGRTRRSSAGPGPRSRRSR